MVNSYDIAILSEKVATLEAALKSAGIELPEVTSEDNGKTLQVVNGAWATGNLMPTVPNVINSLDSTSETDALSAAQGKALNDKITTIKTKTVSMEFNNTGLCALHNLSDIADANKVLVLKVKNTEATYALMLTTYSTGRYALLINSANLTIITTSPTLNVDVIYYE